MALITDGRFSGGSYGLVVGHVAPEAAVGGTIALVQEGDSITVDAHQLLIQLNVEPAELEQRRAAWVKPGQPPASITRDARPPRATSRWPKAGWHGASDSSRGVHGCQRRRC